MFKQYQLSENIFHGNLVFYHGIGCLLLGVAGSGKSLFSQWVIGHGGKLVADDIVHLSHNDGIIYGNAAPGGMGRMEIYGLGIIDLDATEYLEQSPIDYVFYQQEIAQTPRIYTPENVQIGTYGTLPAFPIDYQHSFAWVRFVAYLRYGRADNT